MGAIPISRHRYKERKAEGRKVYKDVIIPQEMKLSSKAYQKLVAKIEGKPEARIPGFT